MMDFHTASLFAQSAQTPSNNADPNLAYIASIVVAIISATPPAITALTSVVTNLRNEREKGKTLAPKVIKIVRQPLGERKWKKAKKKLLITTILFVLTFLINAQSIRLNGKLYFLYSLYYSLCSVLEFRAYRRLGRRPDDSKFFLFEKACVVLEADYESVFTRCQETLRILGAEIIEFDPDKNLLEASTGGGLSGLIDFVGGVFQIEIIELKDNELVRTELTIRVLASGSDTTFSLYKSSRINRFIRFFMHR